MTVIARATFRSTQPFRGAIQDSQAKTIQFVLTAPDQLLFDFVCVQRDKRQGEGRRQRALNNTIQHIVPQVARCPTLHQRLGQVFRPFDSWI